MKCEKHIQFWIAVSKEIFLNNTSLFIFSNANLTMDDLLMNDDNNKIQPSV
jgi:hypothetical protein